MASVKRVEYKSGRVVYRIVICMGYDNKGKAKAEGLEELPIIPLHGLRHSCATLLNYLEVNIIEISKTLGHSTCSTTMNIYAHSFEEQQEEVATKVNEFLRLNA